MRMNTTQKVYLSVLLVVTAVVLCTLPFLLIDKETIYIYTQNQIPNSKERGFIDELKKNGYRVIFNKQISKKQKVAIWFKSPNTIREIMTTTPFEYNFVYNEDYYPFNWQGLIKQPIILTPYQELYEHYMRSNIKSAVFYLGVNLKEYYPIKTNKQNIAYYEQRTASSDTGAYLSTLDNINYIGRFWINNLDYNASSEIISKNENDMLSRAYAVVIDGDNHNKLIPDEIIQAAASGALIITPKTDIVYKTFQDSLVYYSNKEDIKDLASYYKKHETLSADKTNKARQIVVNKLSSSASVKRFLSLLEWITTN